MYNNAAEFATPASETVTLASGETTALTRTYTALARLTVILSEPNAMWQLDGGGWRNSGATAANLAPGSHTISYTNNDAALPPPTESVTLQAGEALTISRNYTPAGQVLITLSPSTAQWRVDGGAWRATNTYSGLLAAGTHTIEYSPAATRLTPPAETITIGAGQTLELLRVYRWESVLTVNLTPANGQWRIDGGAWRNSGERVDQLTDGNHTIDYSTVDGYGVLPAESVVLNEGGTRTISRTYPPPPAHLTVNLSDPNGRWQVDSLGWRSTGETINLIPGIHVIYYQNTTWALAPATETLTFQPDQSVTISRDYTPAGMAYVTLNPSAAQYRVDGGSWRINPSYTQLIPAGTHTLEYSAVSGKATPPAETINIVAGQTLTVSRTYAAESFLTITLTPAVGQWRVDGGAWRNSGERVGQLAAGSHSVEYNAVSGYLAPPSETVVLTTGGGQTLTRSYVRPASLTVALNLTEGQWRINNGPWQASGATLSGLRPGSYTIQFSSIAGYFAPYEEVITLGRKSNQSRDILL